MINCITLHTPTRCFHICTGYKSIHIRIQKVMVITMIRIRWISIYLSFSSKWLNTNEWILVVLAPIFLFVRYNIGTLRGAWDCPTQSTELPSLRIIQRSKKKMQSSNEANLLSDFEELQAKKEKGRMLWCLPFRFVRLICFGISFSWSGVNFMGEICFMGR